MFGLESHDVGTTGRRHHGTGTGATGAYGRAVRVIRRGRAGRQIRIDVQVEAVGGTEAPADADVLGDGRRTVREGLGNTQALGPARTADSHGVTREAFTFAIAVGGEDLTAPDVTLAGVGTGHHIGGRAVGAERGLGVGQDVVVAFVGLCAVTEGYHLSIAEPDVLVADMALAERRDAARSLADQVVCGGGLRRSQSHAGGGAWAAGTGRDLKPEVSAVEPIRRVDELGRPHLHVVDAGLKVDFDTGILGATEQAQDADIINLSDEARRTATVGAVEGQYRVTRVDHAVGVVRGPHRAGLRRGGRNVARLEGHAQALVAGAVLDHEPEPVAVIGRRERVVLNGGIGQQQRIALGQDPAGFVVGVVGLERIRAGRGGTRGAWDRTNDERVGADGAAAVAVDIHRVDLAEPAVADQGQRLTQNRRDRPGDGCVGGFRGAQTVPLVVVGKGVAFGVRGAGRTADQQVGIERVFGGDVDQAGR